MHPQQPRGSKRPHYQQPPGGGYRQQDPYPPQGYAPQGGYPQPPRKSWPSRHKFATGCLGSIGLFVVVIIIVVIAVAVSSGGGSGTGTSAGTTTNTGTGNGQTAQNAGSAAGPAHQTVTYIVTGSPADVTFGPDGTNDQGTVPMRVTRHLHNPQYYAINAQLNGAGSVSCKIKVDGKTISTAHASGSYNIASCEISKDPLTGQWQDTNSG